MARRRKKTPPGIPEWVVTFGDMMALLLVFFILIQMFSELKRDHEYQRVITAVREAFGYSGGVGVLPVDDPPVRSMIEQLEQLAMKSYSETRSSESPTDSVDGRHMRVTTIREGLIFTIGGPSTFDPESAQIKEPVRDELAKLATMLAGRKNKITIRGHAANKYLSPDAPWDDLHQLSYERARNVQRILVENGLDERVFRIEVVGRWEPVRSRVLGIDESAENRRVEVILTETLVDDLDSDAGFTDPGNAGGG